MISSLNLQKNRVATLLANGSVSKTSQLTLRYLKQKMFHLFNQSLTFSTERT